MTTNQIIQYRLLNQQIARTKFTKPELIVSHLTAMQAQDWSMAKWAIGLRLPGSTNSDIEEAFNSGKILRTHMLRPTWHFVTPEDIRWVQQLTAPRVQVFNETYNRKQNLDKKIFKRSNDLLFKSLRDHNYLCKTSLKEIFEKNRIKTDDLRLTYILINAELEGIICSGPRIGKQFTYALIEEKTPAGMPFFKDEALSKLTSAFFKTRGPATIHDFTWWSSLTVKEANEGIATLDSEFIHETFNEKEYIFYDHSMVELKKMQSTFLMPDYDEYGIGYKDRSVYNKFVAKGETIAKGAEYYHAIVVDGYFGGTWERKMKGDHPIITVNPLKSLNQRQLNDIEKARKHYLKFFM